jgi:hypothetical protein
LPTDDAANLLTSDIDQEMQNSSQEKNRRRIFLRELWRKQGIDRGLSYAPYADLIWMETNPDLDYARKFAEGIHAKFPGKCWHTIVLHHLIGPQNYQLLKWKRSARILLQWDTNSLL